MRICYVISFLWRFAFIKIRKYSNIDNEISLEKL